MAPTLAEDDIKFFNFTEEDMDLFRKRKRAINWKRLYEETKPWSENFMDEFYEFIDLKLICEQQKLSESFLEKYNYQIGYSNMFKYQKLSEEFILKNWDHIKYHGCLRDVYKYQTLSENFIDQNKHLVEWYEIFKYQNLSEDFIKNHLSHVSRDIFRDFPHKFDEMTLRRLDKYFYGDDNNDDDDDEGYYCECCGCLVWSDESRANRVFNLLPVQKFSLNCDDKEKTK